MKGAIFILLFINYTVTINLPSVTKENLYSENKLHSKITNKSLDSIEILILKNRSKSEEPTTSKRNKTELITEKQIEHTKVENITVVQKIIEPNEKSQVDFIPNKNMFEFFPAIINYVWKKINPDPEIEFPFKTGSHLQNFYYYVFPFLKLFTLIIILFIIFFFIKSFFKLFKKSSELNKNKIVIEVITNPNAHLINSINSVEKEKSISLKGRTKRVPKPINYNELFSVNDSYYDKNTIKQSNHLCDSLNNSHYNQNNDSISSIEEFFHKLNEKSQTQEFIFEFNPINKTGKNQLSDTTHNLEIISGVPNCNLNKFSENLYKTHLDRTSKFRAKNKSLEIVKEQLENEVDKNSSTYQKLLTNYHVQKNETTNIPIKSNSNNSIYEKIKI